MSAQAKVDALASRVHELPGEASQYVVFAGTDDEDELARIAAQCTERHLCLEVAGSGSSGREALENFRSGRCRELLVSETHAGAVWGPVEPPPTRLLPLSQHVFKRVLRALGSPLRVGVNCMRTAAGTRRTLLLSSLLVAPSPQAARRTPCQLRAARERRQLRAVRRSSASRAPASIARVPLGRSRPQTRRSRRHDVLGVRCAGCRETARD